MYYVCQYYITYDDNITYDDIIMAVHIQSCTRKPLADCTRTPPHHTHAHTQPVVIVPAGREPEQLLYLFKGKFVVHRSKVSLYQSSSTMSAV